MSATIKLQKKGRAPDEPTLASSLYVDDTTLNVISQIIYPDRRKNTDREEEFDSVAEAEEALAKEVARLQADGYELLGAPPPTAPAPKPKASAPGKPAPKAKWVGGLPDRLAKQLKDYETRARKGNLAHRFDEIAVLMRPGIDFTLKKAKPADLKGVVSRLGGEPDLPAGFTWPKTKNVPLTFVAQVVLDDLKEHDLEKLLPKGGVLSFFAQLDPGHPEYGDQCVVAHFPKAGGLTRVAPPESASSTAKKVGLLSPKSRLTVPPSEGPPIDQLGFTGDERDVYHDSLFLGPIPQGRHHMLLGWPNAATHHGIKGKRFLAQFDSDHHIDFEMGDHDTLRFYIVGDVIDDAALKKAVCTFSRA